jgi:hypothetical protein
MLLLRAFSIIQRRGLKITVFVLEDYLREKYKIEFGGSWRPGFDTKSV